MVLKVCGLFSRKLTVAYRSNPSLSSLPEVARIEHKSNKPCFSCRFDLNGSADFFAAFELAVLRSYSLQTKTKTTSPVKTAHTM
jgi:hypothetical protein